MRARRPGGPVDRRLLRESHAARLTLAASVALGLVSTGTVVVQAMALAHLLASAMPGGDTRGDVRALVALACAGALRGLAALGGELVASEGATRVKASLRSRLVKSAIDPTLGAAGPNRGAGALATLAGRGLDSLDIYVGRCLGDFVLAASAPLALAFAIGALDWISGLVVCVAIALFPVFGALVGRASTSLAARRWAQLEALGHQVEDVFRGLAVLKAFGRSREQRRMIEQASEALRATSMGTLRIAFLSALVLDTLASVSVALVAVPLGLRLLHGEVHLASALAVLIVAPEVFLPLRRASSEFHESTEGLAALARVWEHFGPEASRARPEEHAGRPESGARYRRALAFPLELPVALREVSLRFAHGREPLLEGANLEIAPGETVALLGPNGAGKSSVLSLLLGFTQPCAGSVTVGEHSLASLDQDAWRGLLSYLPEHPSLIEGTLADNLRLAEPSASDEELLEALASVGAAELVEKLPGRLEARIEDDGRGLSAGERQRFALARTVLRRASLYLLDEPTVHLDPRSEELVVARLSKVLRGRSALVVTHRPAVTALAHRVLTLREGRFEPASHDPAPAMAVGE